MQASVLGEQDAAIYAYYLAVGEGRLQGLLGTEVLLFVLVEGEQYGGVHDEEVGIVWGHGNEPVGLALQGAEGAEFLQHLGASLAVDDGVVGGEACQGVYVGIRVVALQASVVEPQDALGREASAEFPAYGLLGGRGLGGGAPVIVQVALGGGQYGALAVALYGTAFQFEVQLGHVEVVLRVVGEVLVVELAVDGIVQRCLELASPGIEAEVEQFACPVLAEQCDEGMVACPGVVAGYAEVFYVGQGLAGQFPLEQGADALGLRGHYPEFLPEGYLACHADVASCHLLQRLRPVGSAMRPCQLYGLLGVPFGW